MKEEDEFNAITREIPTMTTALVQGYLTEIGEKWRGKGVAMELGCWLGASAVPLLKGLVTAGYNKQFWAFERWKAYPSQIRKARAQGLHLSNGQDTRLLFLSNVHKVYKKVMAIKGMFPRVLERYAPGENIEICIFDAPKADPVFSLSIKALYRHWILGVTILGLLDYNFYKGKTGDKREQSLAPHRFIDRNRGCFELIKEWDGESSVFFRYINPLRNI